MKSINSFDSISLPDCTVHCRQCDISSDIHISVWECSHRSDHSCRRACTSAHMLSCTPEKSSLHQRENFFLPITHLFILALLLRNFLALLLIHCLAVLLWCLDALLGVACLASLLGHLLAVELVGQATLLLGDLLALLHILAMLDWDLSALRLGGTIAGGSIHRLI